MNSETKIKFFRQVRYSIYFVGFVSNLACALLISTSELPAHFTSIVFGMGVFSIIFVPFQVWFIVMVQKNNPFIEVLDLSRPSNNSNPFSLSQPFSVLQFCAMIAVFCSSGFFIGGILRLDLTILVVSISALISAVSALAAIYFFSEPSSERCDAKL